MAHNVHFLLFSLWARLLDQLFKVDGVKLFPRGQVLPGSLDNRLQPAEAGGGGRAIAFSGGGGTYTN